MPIVKEATPVIAEIVREEKAKKAILEEAQRKLASMTKTTEEDKGLDLREFLTKRKLEKEEKEVKKEDDEKDKVKESPDGGRSSDKSKRKSDEHRDRRRRDDSRERRENRDGSRKRERDSKRSEGDGNRERSPVLGVEESARKGRDSPKEKRRSKGSRERRAEEEKTPRRSRSPERKRHRGDRDEGSRSKDRRKSRSPSRADGGGEKRSDRKRSPDKDGQESASGPRSKSLHEPDSGRSLEVSFEEAKDSGGAAAAGRILVKKLEKEDFLRCHEAGGVSFEDWRRQHPEEKLTMDKELVNQTKNTADGVSVMWSMTLNPVAKPR